MIRYSWFKHAQLLYGLIALLIKDARHKSFIAETAKVVNGPLHFFDTAPHCGVELSAIIAKYPPAFSRQLIVAHIVGWDAVGTGVPRITVSFYIDEALMAKHSKVEKVPFLFDGKFPLAFGFDIQCLKLLPHEVFKWTFIKQVVDLFSRLELGPGGWDESQTTRAETENGMRKGA